ncbi:MAG: YerC/YecD family TrpR-related protein [Candidatus Saccharimonadales bacterium]
MRKQANKVWGQTPTQQLAQSLVAIENATDMRNFLRDVMTEKEIIEISMRLAAAQMLEDKIKYSEIVNDTKLSSRTVARISDWMKNGCGGYAAVLKQSDNNSHTPPVHAG